jgi:hypothetical protein
MAKRRRRRRADREVERGDVARREVYVADLVLEARLLGRIRLLTINAAIDVAEPTSGWLVRPLRGAAAVWSPDPHSHNDRARPASPSLRRAEAEALLGDAERTLTAARA